MAFSYSYKKTYNEIESNILGNLGTPANYVAVPNDPGITVSMPEELGPSDKDILDSVLSDAGYAPF